MIDKQRNIGTWITIALLLFGMVTGAIAFTVTTNNKTNTNEQRIIKNEKVDYNQDERMRTLENQSMDVKAVKKSMEEMKGDNKKSSENQTKILVAIGRLETKIEGLENR